MQIPNSSNLASPPICPSLIRLVLHSCYYELGTKVHLVELQKHPVDDATLHLIINLQPNKFLELLQLSTKGLLKFTF